MATKQRIVHGAASKWGDASADPVVYAAIPECKALVVPVIEPEWIDATSLDSSGGFREYVKGLTDPGEIEIPCGYTSALFATADGYREDGTLLSIETTLPLERGQTTPDKFVFEGYVTPSIQGDDVGGIIGLSLKIRCTGAYTFTAGS
ncbi:hypothetical protein DSD19_06285 [Rhodovulum sp. BSW8]|uniref:hypothetical protein n=1 Tax=Rhodovulum sp. BSW8 TaxID=2259645 RepID=UPI000DE26148|nr:hypothetical protein [Rhodovulum sp. BSW8]RBO54065.1 hypothetical protein DSD19_06285 [Rhodovulum sp. BSW8]